MGDRTGVEAREKSIRMFFVTEDGAEHRETLRLDGKPMLPTPANLKYAKRLALEIRSRISAGVFDLTHYFPASKQATVGQAATVAQQLDAWISAQRVSPTTLPAYRSAASFWMRAMLDGCKFGDRPLKKVKPSDVMRVMAAASTVSGKTLNNYRSVLQSSMELAVLDKTLAENPVTNVASNKWQRPPVAPFSADEAELIIADMAKHYPAQIANMVEFWMFTGLRTSELFGLKWDSVDLAKGTALIHEVIVRGEEYDRTKTSVARTVRLNSRAMAAVQRQRAHTQMKGAQVFLSPATGKAWLDERTWRLPHWEPCLKRLKLAYRRPYNCRHTYASMMLMAGMRAAFCAKQLGHSIEVFHSTYARWIDGEADDNEMAALERSIGRAREVGNE